MSGRHAAPRRTRTPRSDRRSRPWTPAVVALVGALGLGGGLGTQAFWTDAAEVQGSTLSSGTLNMLVDGNEGNPTAYPWIAIARTNLAPGESAAETLTIGNDGSVPFTVAIEGRAGGSLDPAQVSVTVVRGGTPTDDATYPRTETCTGGTAAWSGALTGTRSALFTEPAIAVAGSSVLCVVFTLSSGAPNSAQGQTYVPIFYLTATQS